MIFAHALSPRIAVSAQKTWRKLNALHNTIRNSPISVRPTGDIGRFISQIDPLGTKRCPQLLALKNSYRISLNEYTLLLMPHDIYNKHFFFNFMCLNKLLSFVSIILSTVQQIYFNKVFRLFSYNPANKNDFHPFSRQSPIPCISSLFFFQGFLFSS